jgi:hypothetical protein
MKTSGTLKRTVRKDSQDRTAEKGQPGQSGQDNQDRTAETAQPQLRQESWERTA